MKIVHFADLHLGIDTIGKMDPSGTSVRILDVYNALESITLYVEDSRPDLVIFAGDAYHRNLPTPTQVTMFSSCITRMSKVCPVVIVIGNHDMFGTASKRTALDIFSAVNSSNIFIGNKPMNISVSGVNLTLLPYPDRTVSQDQFEQSLITLSEEFREQEVFSILVAHCSVEGATYGSERTIMGLGHDPILPIDLLRSTSYDYVALGHIHVLQDLGSDDSMPIVYPGCPLQLDFGDEGKDTGFIELMIGEGLDISFVSIDSRKFHTVVINDNEYDPTDLAKDYADSHVVELDGSIVRINIILEDDYAVNIEEIVAYYYKLGCLSCVVNVSRPRVTRTSSYDGNIASLSPLELTKLYFKDAGVKGTDLKTLLELSKEIMDEPIS